MKTNLRENYIVAILILFIVLLMISSALILLNKQSAQRGYKEQETAAQAIYELSSNHLGVIRMADISIRGYALVREERFLFMAPDSLEQLMNATFTRLNTILATQNYKNSRGLAAIKAYQEYIVIMVDDYRKMVTYLGNRQDSLFFDLLRQDKGARLGPLIADAEKYVLSFENNVAQDASGRIQFASNSNIYVQFFVLLLGIPSICFLIVKINKDQAYKKKMLSQLEANNKKFLFNSGAGNQNADFTAIINDSITNLENASEFVNHLSTGNYKVDWPGLNDKNRTLNAENLAGKLTLLKENLLNVQIEDHKRLWHNECLNGLAAIVRKYQGDFDNFGGAVVSYLAKCIEAQQIGLFIKDEEGDKTVLKLLVAFAYDKKRFGNRVLYTNEGLIGQVFMEKESIIIDDIPEDYWRITSGLGDALPGYLAIVPFCNNGEVEAVAEMGSFSQILPYQVHFLEKAGEIIASSLAQIRSVQKRSGRKSF